MLFALIVAALAAAQVSPPKDNKYEIVSIKAASGPGYCGYQRSRVLFSVQGCSLEYLIRNLYSTGRGWGLVGLPKWTSSAWYAINARSAKPANPGEQWLMLKPVLEDRFKLKWHLEKRQMAVYYLSAAASGVRLPVTVPGSCVPIDPNVGPPPPQPGTPESCGLLLEGRPRKGEVKLDGAGITMGRLASELQSLLGRPVIDQTGSRDSYDVHLEFAGNDLSANQAEADPSGLPSIFAALKKAGLALKPGRGPVEVAVIDSVQKPSEN